MQKKRIIIIGGLKGDLLENKYVDAVDCRP